VHLTISTPAGATSTEMFMVIVSGSGIERIAWLAAVGH